MFYGISIYQTDEYKTEGNIEYIKKAGEIGYNLLFTSLHLPEQSVDFGVIKEFINVFKIAKAYKMAVIADISPSILNIFTDLKEFQDIGINILRIDYGFSADKIAKMTLNKYGINICINASTVTRILLEELKKLGADFKRIYASHNFYPRPETGLSYRFLLEKSYLCKEYDLPVIAFIPSQKGKRGPLYEGLPTLEIHRQLKAELAAKHLLYAGVIDGVVFGDAYASQEELLKVRAIDPGVIELNIELYPQISDEEKKIVFLPSHTSRLDSPEYIIRSEESRGYARIGVNIKPGHNIERKAYSVTIDNEMYKRYSGELQIVLKDFPEDERVNVVGRIPDEEYILVNQIKPGKKFRFTEGRRK